MSRSEIPRRAELQRRAIDATATVGRAARRRIAPLANAVTARRLGQLAARHRDAGVDLPAAVDDALLDAVSTLVSDSAAQRRPLDDRWQSLICEAFSGLYAQDLDTPPSAAVHKTIVDQFHRLYYHDTGTWRQTFWLGTKIWKCPLDLWLYQEMLHEVRPGLIVETGTAFGGSANYLGHLCDILGKGSIVSIDIDDRADRPEHERVTYIHGSSVDPDVVARVSGLAHEGEPVIVILDSDHSETHVYAELQAYADLVTPNSYLIVEDTNVNGHPAFPEHGPGPMEALDRFLAERKDFSIDESKHKFHMTFNPRGVLKKSAR
ncbi:MAG: hypothetical protein QOJ62_1583 [Actinomycetota bacterium]|nr:hypothetical protein [Actinomycetota bacterium]